MRFPLILFVLSLVTHLIFFGQPRSVVFDETYHGTFTSAYSTGEYFFDIHPPFARLLIKLVGDIGGVSYDMDFGSIGNELNSDILVLRLLPVLAGIFLPLIIYFICRKLKISEISAFVIGLIMCFENSLIVQSKFLLFDSLLLLFGFLSILTYLIYREDRSRRGILFLSIIFSACTFSIKWTGLAFPFIIILYEIIKSLEDRKFNLLKILKFVSSYTILGLVFYFSVFAIHFSLLKLPGPGDAFMEENFQQKSLVGKFIELNGEMYRANATLTANHDYASSWYSWPFMVRSVFYWQNVEQGKYIYFLGNPIIYWLGLISLILISVVGVKNLIKKKKVNTLHLFILLGFLVNFLPFSLIGRVMFLYHYQAALVFSIIAIALVFDMIKVEKDRILISSILVIVCFLTFVYFAPLTYGLHLETKELENMMWLKSWR